MKKYILMFIAVVGLLATACSKQDGYVADSPTVSFRVVTPDLQTRYGEGAMATELHWEVYMGDTHIEELDGTKEIHGETVVDLRLVVGKTYSLLFWAEAPGQDVYTVENRKLTIDASKLVSNQESYDAFYAYKKDIVISPQMNDLIELRRPFAQLNIATGDGAAANLDLSENQVELEAYTELNMVNGQVSNKQTLTYGAADRATGGVVINQKPYDLISMNYLLVNEKEVTRNVKLTVPDPVEDIVRNYPLVPFQRNHRTFIIGDLFTTGVGFKVVIVDDFENDDFILEE